jgi:Spy/CpxP family protein refolding chaperone
MRFRNAIACICSVVAVAALAGEPRSSASAGAGVPRPGPPPLERFVGPLSLTPAQQAKLRPLFAEAQKQAAKDVEEAGAEGKTDRHRLATMLAMHAADFRTKLADVLTPEQLTKYEGMTADRTPREQAAEMHSAHGHHEVDTPATAAESD